MRNALIFSATAAALVVVACNHDTYPPATANTTGAYAVNNDDAVRRLTDAHCDHAKVCNKLGENKSFPDEGACKREVHHDMQADLRVGECPGGIRERRLAQCLQEIQNEKCGNPLDKISRIATCRSGALCID